MRYENVKVIVLATAGALAFALGATCGCASQPLGSDSNVPATTLSMPADVYAFSALSDPGVFFVSGSTAPTRDELLAKLNTAVSSWLAEANASDRSRSSAQAFMQSIATEWPHSRSGSQLSEFTDDAGNRLVVIMWSKDF